MTKCTQICSHKALSQLRTESPFSLVCYQNSWKCTTVQHRSPSSQWRKKTMPFLPLLREICSFEGQEKVDHLCLHTQQWCVHSILSTKQARGGNNAWYNGIGLITLLSFSGQSQLNLTTRVPAFVQYHFFDVPSPHQNIHQVFSLSLKYVLRKDGF